MSFRARIPASAAFEAVARGSSFRDQIVTVVNAPPAAIFRALRAVRLSDMKLAWLLGEIRYLPLRLSGRSQPGANAKPFFDIVTESGSLVLHDDTPRELIVASAAQLHHVNQAPRRFASREAFETFSDPEHEKLFISVRVAPTGRLGENWLVLEHATRALSSSVERKFARYWRVIKPAGALVSWQLLRAVRRRAERETSRSVRLRPVWRSVRATEEEHTRALPGDERIAAPVYTLTHGVTIRGTAHDVWPWLVQMGAGSRAGWYSYDWLDNGRRPSAKKIVAALQHPAIGATFPAAPGMTAGFTLLAAEPERVLMLGWPTPAGAPEATWTYVLEETAPGVTRLLVRVRTGRGYHVRGLPPAVIGLLVRAVHFVMERRQLLGITARVEQCAAGGQPQSTSREDAA